MTAQLIAECTCDRDPCGICPEHGYFTGTVGDAAYAVWNETLADCLKELPDQRLYRVVFGLCLTCGSAENMRDSDGCWPCYDKRMVDNEAFARHGGDV